MSPQLNLCKFASSFGMARESARSCTLRGDVDGARFWAKHARADFRQLCRMAHLPEPKPHATADTFSF